MALVAAVGMSCRPCVHSARPPQFIAPHDFSAHPPVVQSLAIQLVDGGSGTARLLVEYQPDARLEPQLTLDLGGGPTLFRDDGEAGDRVARDFVYTGTTPLDVKALHARWHEIAAIMESPGYSPRQPRFSGREITEFVTVPPIDIPALTAALSAGEVVPLNLVSTCALTTVDPKASLFITHPDVMRDSARTYVPCGPSGPEGSPGSPWSFGYLMRQLAGGPTTSDAAVSTFIRNWLDQWTKPQGTNGEALPPRPLLDALIVQPWKAASASAGLEFDPAKAPFRLLAIVNRIDKSDSVVYGASSAPRPGNAGEVRFVFGALSSQCQPLRFSVIFEYTVDRSDCTGVAQWGRDWMALSEQGLGSAAYRQQLAQLTDQVVTPGALGQLRTNEISLDDPDQGSVWDMREFQLVGGQLVQRSVAQTPQGNLDGTTVLRDYINANRAAIAAEQYEVPANYPDSTPFRGDHAFGKPALTFWDTSGILPVVGPGATPTPATVVRHVFSRNTCNGCHNAETGTNGTHVNPMVNPDAPGQLSEFVTGITAVADPTDPTRTYDFNDLNRRRADLSAAANLGCVCQLSRRPIAAPH